MPVHNQSDTTTQLFETRFKPEEFENAGFSSQRFENAADGREWWRHDNHVISLLEFSSNTNLIWPVIGAISNSSGVVWTENIRCKSKFLFEGDYISLLGLAV